MPIYINATAQHISALRRFAADHGSHWKSHLMKHWQDQKVKPSVPYADAPLLRQLRNNGDAGTILKLSATQLAELQVRRAAE